MRLKLNPSKEELIKNMLKTGMKVGEIQVIFPYINSATIHTMGKNLGVNTRQNKKEEKRDLQEIRRVIQQGINDEIITETPRLESFLESIDREIRKNEMGTNLKERIKANPDASAVRNLNTSTNNSQNYRSER